MADSNKKNNQNNDKKRPAFSFFSIVLWAILLVLLLNTCTSSLRSASNVTVPYTEFRQWVAQGYVDSVQMESSAYYFTVKTGTPPLVEYAEEIGQDFAIEPVCRHIVCTPERAKRVLDAFPQKHFRIILDAVNLLSPANYMQADEITRQAIELLGDRVSLLHMKDYTSEAKDWFGSGVADLKSVGCGLGAMRYEDLLAFAKAHPGMPMTLEDTKPENAEQCRLHLENTAALLP